MCCARYYNISFNKCAKIYAAIVVGVIAADRPVLALPATASAAQSGSANRHRLCPSTTTASSAAKRQGLAMYAPSLPLSSAPRSGSPATPRKNINPLKTTKIVLPDVYDLDIDPKYFKNQTYFYF